MSQTKVDKMAETLSNAAKKRARSDTPTNPPKITTSSEDSDITIENLVFSATDNQEQKRMKQILS